MTERPLLATNCRPAEELHMDTDREKKTKEDGGSSQRDTIFHCDQSCLSVEMVYHGKLQSDQF